MLKSSSFSSITSSFGIQVDDKDSLDIRYEGASDDEGISETQTSEVVVYRVSKEKVESTELPKEEVIDEKFSKII